MCGIAGFISLNNSFKSSSFPFKTRLAAMLDTLAHRGPDDWGMFFRGFGENGPARDCKVHVQPQGERALAFGHRRLSILDTSDSGRQPMQRSELGLTITFNGEIYNYLELREQLDPGYEIFSGTDTEILLLGYHQWGLDVLDKLDGMFSFAIWDEHKNRIVCARDQAGIKPFYYSLTRDCLMFGSEPRAILAGQETTGWIDEVRLSEFLVMGLSDHDEGSFYKDIHQLSGGHFLVIEGSSSEPVIRSFWNPIVPDVEIEDVVKTVRDQVNTAVMRQLRSDVPVGSCLSGGLDSGAIVYNAGQILAENASEYNCLTLTNPDFELDEAENASASAKKAGCKWVPVTPKPADIKLEIQEMSRCMGEPFSGLSNFAQYKIMERASELGLKVMLDGQGGDEVFIGYPRMAQQIVWEHLKSGNIVKAVSEIRGMKHNISQSPLTVLASMAYFRSYRIGLTRNLHRMRPFLNGGLESALRLDVAKELYAPNSFQTRQLNELRRFCLPRLLRFEDRMSMAFSVEARVPLLSRSLIETGLSLPLHWKLNNGWSKYALRKAMSGYLPDSVVWNTLKQGFDVPERVWMETLRDDIRSWGRDIKYLPINVDAILKAIDQGLGGQQWLFRLVSAVLWIRQTGVKI